MNNKIKWLLKKNISFIKPIAKKLVSKNQKKYIYTWRIMLGKVSFTLIPQHFSLTIFISS